MTFGINIISLALRRPFVHLISVYFSLILVSPTVLAVGLGEIRVRSSLGQSLVAKLDIVGAEDEVISPSCVRARVITMEGTFVASANVALNLTQRQRSISFTTRPAINEPAVKLIVDINCETQLHREFLLLLDLPETTEMPSRILGNSRDDVSLENQSNQQPARLESQASSPSTSPKSSKISNNAETSAKIAIPKPRRKNTPNTLADAVPVEKPTQSDLKPVNTQVATKKNRDVLKLSDEVQVVAQGLRMSDVLSSDSGKELLRNAQELQSLREAQAKMAALLRDEKGVEKITEILPSSLASPTAQTTAVNESAEILKLKKEAERLQRQSLQDKSALAELKNKAPFDFWIWILAIVATVSVAIILFLLFYIKRKVHALDSHWWENTEPGANSVFAVPIEEVIDGVQASYYSKPIHASESPNSSAKSPSRGAASDNVDLKKETRSNEPNTVSGGQRTPTLEETNSSIFNFFLPRGSSVAVEEISDVTQEAEFWISMNDPQRAIEILSAQEQVEHPDSPLPWLFLLDLYRSTNNQHKYDPLRERFIVFFNANIPEFNANLSEIHHRHLEDFGHLMEQVCQKWGGSDIVPFLESLLVDDREGKRVGFDLPVYRDILMLLGIAHELERIKAIEGSSPYGTMSSSANEVEPEAPIPDPVAEADFGTIEFEVINFPKPDIFKNK
ncbi:MAG: hypothetical protein K2P84_03740 [Undibacterium sp.]|nr:hypothetical protein [Undibacterium sp.]